MIIYGKQLFLHLLDKHPDKFVKVFLSKEVEKEIFTKLIRSGLSVQKIDNKKAQAMSRSRNHQGFLAEVSEFEFANLNEIKKLNKVVVLYALSDVGNIGAIVRTAYGLGCDGILVVAKSIAIDGVIRASNGAAYEIPIAIVDDGLSLLNELKQTGFSIYGSSMNAKAVKDIRVANKFVLIMGSEGGGMPKRAYRLCDELIGIKMQNGLDSLNVSVAFGILFDRIVNG